MHIRISEDKKLSKLESNGLRPFQNQVYEHRDEKIIVINAMTGAGKSICSQTIALYKLAEEQVKRVIIAVPQKSIGVNFREYPVKAFEHAEKYHVSLDLIDGTDTTSRLKQFFKSGTGICICTHASLVSAQVNVDQFDDCLLVIDEAHHVSASEDLMNHLGISVNNCMSSKGHTVLMTATPFRSDAASIVPSGFDYASSFFSITEFLSSCKHLRGINTEFDLHECDSYLDRINEIDFSRKTAIYIPVTGSYESRDVFDKNSKENHISSVMEKIGIPKGRDEFGFYLLERKGRLLRVADLVNDEGPQQAALDDTRKTGECDIVLSMSKAKEGWDYPCIEQVVIIGARGSLSDTLQMIGRGVRDYEAKETCYVRILAQIADVESEEVREQTARFLKTVYCAQLLEDIMIPAKLFNLKRIPKENGEQENILPAVKEAIEDPAINARIGEAMRNLPTSIQLGNSSEIKEAILNIIRTEQAQFSEDEVAQFERALKLCRHLRSEVIKKDLSLEFAGTINVDDIDFAVIDDVSHVSQAVAVLAKGMGLEGFESLRTSLANDFYETLEEASTAVQKLEIKGRVEYQKAGRYKEDLRLTANPDRVYKNQWDKENWTWEKFLGNEEKVNPYPTLHEALLAVQKLGIRSSTEYINRYKEDPKLPSSPWRCYDGQYRDKFNWNKFLNQTEIYPTLQEAHTAVKKLGIKSSREYIKDKIYKKDTRLPAEPRLKYKSQINGRGTSFLV
ncbi:integrase repeat-containing protein [Lentisphaera profundi]|uniref:Integrase repeat-containing protein n=1 Tax=Lentisphaera profundi TaxID=1658616 RepID=A0ABY7VZ36_9BACT|nr:integrase repeat-containing protein [Lentisphaera profundi]WDE98528.1 integrase repeat-containing protein [Lentisphaera profundi]